MAKRNQDIRPYDRWAAEMYERSKGEPRFPGREVLSELGYDLDVLIDRWRKKRSRQAARRTSKARR